MTRNGHDSDEVQGSGVFGGATYDYLGDLRSNFVGGGRTRILEFRRNILECDRNLFGGGLRRLEK
jgi:hypothetical protein